LITTREYWELAWDVHARDPQANPPQRFICDRVEISKGFFGSGNGNRNGFQAALYTPVTARGNRLDVKVLAIAGTQGLAMNDIGADARIGLHVMPQQASSAFKFYQSAVGNEGLAIIVGHSLGGALAQVLGYWCDCPFVTFNAPGMASILAAARWNFLKPDVARRTRAAKRYRSSIDNTPRGLNFVTAGDLVAKFGKHVGEVIVLRNGLNAPALVSNHVNFQMPLFLTQVNGRYLSDLDPFMLSPEELSAAGA
jgi:hypothetical protein